MTRKFYAAQWQASDPVAVEECVQVLAFRSAKERAEWVARGRRGNFYGDGYGISSDVRTWSREALTRARAERYMSAIMHSAYGGRPSGRAALREVRVSDEI